MKRGCTRGGARGRTGDEEIGASQRAEKRSAMGAEPSSNGCCDASEKVDSAVGNSEETGGALYFHLKAIPFARP